MSNLDTQSVYIGDIIIWTIKAKNVKGSMLYFPDLNIESDSVNVKYKSSLYENDNLEGIEFELVFWDTGQFQTPEYQIQVLDSSGAIGKVINVLTLDINIKSSLSGSKDFELKPLQGPVPVRMVVPFKNIIYLIILFSSIFGMFWIWNHRMKRNYRKLNYDIFESPGDRAMRRLSNLNPNLLSKTFYTDLSHISRQYIEKKYFVRALEMTTDEIKNNRALFPINDEQFTKWVNVLNLSDKVKYANEKVNTEQLKIHLGEIKQILADLSKN
tara:strand:- start:55095 stop:55904 length:810 start_codon:yes stop_codon:yes gene_type:complete